MPLDPAVAEVRSAVRRCLATAPAGPVLVACSGGADSWALLSAAVFECRAARQVWGVTVDHGLQPGSAERAQGVAAAMRERGVHQARVVAVSVDPAGRGLEAAAREARYAALRQVAEEAGSGVILLGHTLEDQAETVLLGLTRGSGARSLAGMPAVVGAFHRPLLSLSRSRTRQACHAQGLQVWDDPHNDDPRFTRPRIRHAVLPVLEDQLGPGVTEALARTAELVREDCETLDDLADAAFGRLRSAHAGDGASGDDESADPGAVVVDAGALAELPAALRRRVLRSAALQAGTPGGELFRVHVLAMDALVTRWRGQGPVQLPGHRTAYRSGGLLCVRGPAVAG